MHAKTFHWRLRLSSPFSASVPLHRHEYRLCFHFSTLFRTNMTAMQRNVMFRHHPPSLYNGTQLQVQRLRWEFSRDFGVDHRRNHFSNFLVSIFICYLCSIDANALHQIAQRKKCKCVRELRRFQIRSNESLFYHLETDGEALGERSTNCRKNLLFSYETIGFSTNSLRNLASLLLTARHLWMNRWEATLLVVVRIHFVCTDAKSSKSLEVTIAA